MHFTVFETGDIVLVYGPRADANIAAKRTFIILEGSVRAKCDHKITTEAFPQIFVTEIVGIGLHRRIIGILHDLGFKIVVHVYLYGFCFVGVPNISVEPGEHTCRLAPICPDLILGQSCQLGGQLLAGISGYCLQCRQIHNLLHVQLDFGFGNLGGIGFHQRAVIGNLNVGALTVQTLELTLIHLTTQLISQDVQRPETAVMPGTGIFLAGIAQTDDQPGVFAFSKHSLEQILDGGAAVNVGNGAGKDGSNVQELDLAAGGVAHLGNGVQEGHFLDGACLDAVVSRAGENAVGGAGINFLSAANFDQSL